MTEIAVIDASDKKHPHQIEKCANQHCHGTPSRPDHAETTEMEDDEGDGFSPLEALRECPRGFCAKRKVIRVNKAND